VDWVVAQLHGLNPDVDWNYALITLAVRFIGVFVVMLVMQIALQVAARAVRLIEARREAKAVAATVGAEQAVATVPEPTGTDQAAIAAIAMAFALEGERRAAVSIVAPSFSPWSMAGRREQQDRRLR